MLVEILSDGSERPPAGAPIVVRLLDTTYADAPARVIAEIVGQVRSDGEAMLATVDLPATISGPGDFRIRAHVDVDRDGAVSRGDFVSTEAFPAREDQPVRVTVKKV